MEDWPIGPGDLAVLIILLLSAIVAFVRGFVREFLGILAWIGAAIVTLYVFPDAQPFLRQYISIDWMADLITGLAIFIVSLVVFSTLAHFAARGVRTSALSAVDRSLGFLFGLVRGAILVCLAYLVLVYASEDGELPTWVEDARSRPFVEQGAAWLVGLVPEDSFNTGGQFDDLRGRLGNDLGPSLRDISQPQPATANEDASDGANGYNERQRGDLNRVIETAQ
ncbi:MAG: CvpA family protein [Pseudomonadota bacterium]